MSEKKNILPLGKSLVPHIDREEIAHRVKELAAKIRAEYKDKLGGKPLICVAILKGSFIFAADLIRELDLPLHVEFFGASSYGQKTVSSGVVKITLDLSAPIKGKHVLVIEDIVDTGLTLHYLMENLRVRKPASISLCALLLKPSALKKKIPIDYLGFSVENRYLVGYGLDAAERYRNLPYLAILPDELIPPETPPKETS